LKGLFLKGEGGRRREGEEMGKRGRKRTKGEERREGGKGK